MISVHWDRWVEAEHIHLQHLSFLKRLERSKRFFKTKNWDSNVENNGKIKGSTYSILFQRFLCKKSHLNLVQFQWIQSRKFHDGCHRLNLNAVHLEYPHFRCKLCHYTLANYYLTQFFGKTEQNLNKKCDFNRMILHFPI